MPTNTRLSGHTLRSEGAAFVWTRNGGRFVRTTEHFGRGLCSCGAMSDTVDSNAARKRWHAAHKDELRGLANQIHDILDDPTETNVQP